MAFWRRNKGNKEEKGSPLPGSKKDFEALIHEAIHGPSAGPGRFNMQGAQPLLEAVRPDAKPSNNLIDDVLKALKGFIKSEVSETAIRSLLLTDYIMSGADVNFPMMLGKKTWIDRLLNVATTNLDPRVRLVLLQLMSDWTHQLATQPHTRELAQPFIQAIQTLRSKGVVVPPPEVARQPGHLPSAAAGGWGGAGMPSHPPAPLYQTPPGMQAVPVAAGVPQAQSVGVDRDGWQQFPMEDISNIANQTQQIEIQTASYTAHQIHAMLEDIKLLDVAIAAGGKQMAQEGDEIWDAAERCKKWQERVQDMLLQDLDEEILCAVLAGNDSLQMILLKWDRSGTETFPDNFDALSGTAGSESSLPAPPSSDNLPLVDLDGFSDAAGASEGAPAGGGGSFSPAPPQQQTPQQNLQFTPTMSGSLIDSLDPFADGPVPPAPAATTSAFNPTGGHQVSTNPFAMFGSGVAVPDAAAPVAGPPEAVTRAMKAELTRVKEDLANSQARVKETAGKMRELLELNSKLEEDKAQAEQREREAQMQARDFQEQAAAAAGERVEASAREESQQVEALKEQVEAAHSQARQAQTQVQEVHAEKAEVEKQLRLLTKEKENAELKVIELQGKVDAAERNMQKMRASVAEVVDLRARTEVAEKKLHSMSLELKKESILRKKTMNELRALRGNIRVCARIRPAQIAGTSGDQGVEIALDKMDEFTVQLAVAARGGLGQAQAEIALKKYEYDTIFAPEDSQETVYAEARDLLQSGMDGYNVCFFAYGQTGSGKTHTILGSRVEGREDLQGILPRFIRDLFEFHKYGGLEGEVTVHAYMLELYQDHLIDLLAPEKEKSPAKLEVKRDPNTGMVSVDGAAVLPALNADELTKLLDTGLARRKVASTKMNSESSRSHLVFSVLVQNHVKATATTTSGKMTFVDLAGSERVARSGAVNDDQRLAEARAINKSLSALGDVVAALTSEASFVPYRNHKLTQLMADSLGGNAKCCMIVNVSPLQVDCDETRNSLDYASRVKNVTNDASRSAETRETAKYKATIEKLKAEIANLKGGSK